MATEVTKTAPKTAPKSAPKAATKAKEETTANSPLYLPGKMPPVRPGTHRSYAQDIVRRLAKSHPKGFTLQQVRDELISGADKSDVKPPKGGWKTHNMPTWMSHEKQKWIVPAA